MTIHEHYENFMRQPEIEEYSDLYCSILEDKSVKWLRHYYGLLNEIAKDRKLFVTPAEQVKELGK